MKKPKKKSWMSPPHAEESRLLHKLPTPPRGHASRTCLQPTYIPSYRHTFIPTHLHTYILHERKIVPSHPSGCGSLCPSQVAGGHVSGGEGYTRTYLHHTYILPTLQLTHLVSSRSPEERLRHDHPVDLWRFLTPARHRCPLVTDTAASRPPALPRIRPE